MVRLTSVAFEKENENGVVGYETIAWLGKNMVCQGNQNTISFPCSSESLTLSIRESSDSGLQLIKKEDPNEEQVAGSQLSCQEKLRSQ